MGFEQIVGARTRVGRIDVVAHRLSGVSPEPQVVRRHTEGDPEEPWAQRAAGIVKMKPVVDDDENVVRHVGKLPLGNAEVSQRVPEVAELPMVEGGKFLPRGR